MRIPGTLGALYSIQVTRAGVLVGGPEGLFRYDGSSLKRIPGGDAVEGGNAIQDTKAGILVDTRGGLLRYDGSNLVKASDTDLIEGSFSTVQNTKEGVLVGAGSGLYRYDGSTFVKLASAPVGTIRDTQEGVLVGSDDSLFRYHGSNLVKLFDRFVTKIVDTQKGVLLESDNRLFRYDGSSLAEIPDSLLPDIVTIQDTKVGVLVGTYGHGLYRYDGSNLVKVLGRESIGKINTIQDTSAGVLMGVEPYSRGEGLNTVFRVVSSKLSDSKVALENWKDLDGTGPTKLGLPTYWSLIDPCGGVAEEFGLEVIAKDEAGNEYDPHTVEGVKREGEKVFFHAVVPVPKSGKWTFRVVSSTFKTDVGKPSEPITFVTPGLFGFLASWWRTIATSFTALLIALNLLVFLRARYSFSAWRWATDDFWGKSALLPQRLLLSHWQSAQLWLLDLHVQKRRRANSSAPFLALPLTGASGETADAVSVLKRLAFSRHLWVQGSAGMGKTAIFQHLRDLQFGRSGDSAFTIFRRDGYVLVPIEARRFPEAPSSDDKSASAWVVACVRSVLSEGGLTFNDPGLLRAMLSAGTLAVAIDGLNEVAREQAVSAFVADFPVAPMFVTSQESGELPFEVWRLPATIHEHVEGLMELYLGPGRANEMTECLRETGLIQHLRSGYDVRLVIELAKNAPHSPDLPRDRLGLYRAVIAAAWPTGDERLELLQAAAWKLLSERGPNEDKRRLLPGQDAPADLLVQLEAARERSGRAVRLVRLSPMGYEFVHDQINSYLAACWFVDRPAVAVMRDLLAAAKIWQERLETQRTLWTFVSEMLSRTALEELWNFAGDDDRRVVLGGELARRAEREGWTLTRPPAKATETKAQEY